MVKDNQAVNGNNGVFTSFSSTIAAREIVIEEDPVNGSAAGLQIQLLDDSTGVPYATTLKLATGDKMKLGDSIAAGSGHGPTVGLPDQSGGKGSSGQAATLYAKIRSNGAGPTKVKTTETP